MLKLTVKIGGQRSVHALEFEPAGAVVGYDVSTLQFKQEGEHSSVTTYGADIFAVKFFKNSA